MAEFIPPIAQKMELASLKDLLRLLVSIMGRSNGGGHVYYGQKNGNHYFFVTHSVGGWYDLKGLPVTLVATYHEEPPSNFIEYTFAMEGSDESYKFVDHIKQTTQALYIPIIKLKDLPNFMFE